MEDGESWALGGCLRDNFARYLRRPANPLREIPAGFTMARLWLKTNKYWIVN